MPVVEDPPRLVAQLVLLVHGLTALGLDRRKVLGMCTWAALHSIPQQRLALSRNVPRKLHARIGGWLGSSLQFADNLPNTQVTC
jgi:hypothetical protein